MLHLLHTRMLGRNMRCATSTLCMYIMKKRKGTLYLFVHVLLVSFPTVPYKKSLSALSFHFLLK